MEEVILVDEHDREIGLMEKIEAHEKALLHRAFSVFIFNENGEMLLQQRAFTKYHSGGLWTNACCSHPRQNEEVMQAAQRRLQEEMGFTTELKKAFSFTYKAAFDNGLTEHEFDHVFIGTYNGVINFNKDEVHQYKYASIAQIENMLALNPPDYTVWFKIAFEKVKKWMEKK